VNPFQNDVAPFHRPATIAAALAALARGPARFVAGGTDLYATGSAAAPTSAGTALVDLGAVAELRGITRLDDGALRIGATTTWTEIAAFDGPPVLNALRAAAREVGGVQIQNRGTVAGNLCNASPAADGIPPLLALDARVVLRSPRGERHLALADFVTGPRRTALAADELVCAVLLPAQPPRAGSAFAKLGARRYLLISIAMVAVVVEPAAEADAIARARIAVGACGPKPVRLGELEQRLSGLPADDISSLAIAADELVELAPIDDVRASARYRREATAVLVRRALGAAWASAVPRVTGATGLELP
jgi:N-methylhydantoinase B